MTVAKIQGPIYERRPATTVEVYKAAGALFYAAPLPEDQQGWQNLMREHGPGICALFNHPSDLKHRTGLEWNDPKVLKVYEAAIKVGLFGSSDYFDTIPSRLPREIVDGKPEFAITRIVPDPEDYDEQLLIQAQDGELILLTRTGHGHPWAVAKTIWQMNIAAPSPKPIEIRSPLLMTCYEEYIRISEITETLFKVERTARATLACVGFSSSLQDVALGYLGYPSQAEKNQAPHKRKELQQSMKFYVPMYVLPKA